MKKPIKSNLEHSNWNTFKSSGMLFAVNTFLHFFGWVIVATVEEDSIVDIQPARTKFRGFTEKDQEQGHTNVAEYLANNAPNFPEEIK